MTDVPSVQVLAEPQPDPFASNGGPPLSALSSGSPPLHGPIEEDESSTIKCICGFADDDGNTVLCEKCDTWQHILCYYESAQLVPDVHECTDCAPRTVDSKGATDKQRQRRDFLTTGERKGRPKTTAKNPKKRTKDTPPGPVQTNGWPLQSNGSRDSHHNPDRKSASPRDLPPPSKRPKTSHRPSNSISVISHAPALVPGSRKRGGSVIANGHSPVKSPMNLDGPLEEFSSEFMHLYRQPEPPAPDSNMYTSIGVANLISTWLTDTEALADASGGKKPQDLFSRIDTSIDELGAPSISRQTDIDSGVVAHGLNPQWQLITVDSVVPNNGFIGELKGMIGRKQDYVEDPSNRWELLRHPEPFVFFSPHLPIYIDTRREGNILRYVRRSCIPNMTMKFFLDPSNDLHFCFVATRLIEPGEEITIGWELDAEVHKQLAKVIGGGGGFKKIQPWVSCVLANFGGCACDTSSGHQCFLEHARRNTVSEPPKTKGRKTKKSQVSPLSTGQATNSRAGSEALHRDGGDDDQVDARSTSGSHKSSSRDHTPATHLSFEADLKMSEREKRKLEQSEKLFQQMTSHEEHKVKKGKRNSAGSSLNTPSLSSSVRRLITLSLSYTDLDTQKRLGHGDISPSVRHREHSHGVARKTSGSSTKTNGRSVPKPRPVYAEAATQTEDDGAVAVPRCMTIRDMKPPLSFKRKLLQQAQEDKVQRERLLSTSVKKESRSPTLKDMSSNKPSPLPPSPPLDEPSSVDLSTSPGTDARAREPTPARESTPTPTVDVDMEETDGTPIKPDEPTVEEMLDSANPDPSYEPPQDLPHPLPPPWPTKSPAAEAPTRTVELHVDMPTKVDMTNGSHPMVTPSSVAGFLAGTAIAQSPSSVTIGSPFSPSVNNAVNPTPARKKLSLSDYTSRRAKLAQTHSTGSASTPPLAQSQSTSSPTLSTASLPNTNSPPRRSVEPSLLAVDEEPDSPEKNAPTTITTLTTLT
jgi:hypothetical protein